MIPHRAIRFGLSLVVIASLAAAGCGGSTPPENTGEPYEPSPALQSMMGDMEERRKTGEY